jgi:hypothetical protein
VKKLPCMNCSSSACAIGTGPSSSITRRPPCERMERQLQSTGNALSELLAPTSMLPRSTPRKPRLSLPEMEITPSTSLPELPGLTERQVQILVAHYFEKLTHADIGERFGFTEQSSWVILNRLKRRAVKVQTVCGTVAFTKEGNTT